MIGEKKNIIAGKLGFRRMRDSVSNPPHGIPRLHEARLKSITEQAFEWRSKFRRMACRHFQNGRGPYRAILN
jgi:hypothetical protein